MRSISVVGVTVSALACSRIRRDNRCLADGSNRKLEMQHGRSIGSQRKALLQRIESRRLRDEDVVPDRYCCEREFAVLVRLRLLRPVRIRRFQFNVSPGHGSVLRIVNDSSHAAKNRRACSMRRHEQRREKQKAHKLPHGSPPFQTKYLMQRNEAKLAEVQTAWRGIPVLWTVDRKLETGGLLAERPARPARSASLDLSGRSFQIRACASRSSCHIVWSARKSHDCTRCPCSTGNLSCASRNSSSRTCSFRRPCLPRAAPKASPAA